MYFVNTSLCFSFDSFIILFISTIYLWLFDSFTHLYSFYGKIFPRKHDFTSENIGFKMLFACFIKITTLFFAKILHDVHLFLETAKKI